MSTHTHMSIHAPQMQTHKRNSKTSQLQHSFTMLKSELLFYFVKNSCAWLYC